MLVLDRGALARPDAHTYHVLQVWYCVPSSQSDAFEAAMRDALPELFEAAPDLLSQLVTLLDPSELRARGVDVNRVVHTPGSFVVTMPNSFHGGFNTGFNVAESSNFAALPYVLDLVVAS